MERQSRECGRLRWLGASGGNEALRAGLGWDRQGRASTYISKIRQKQGGKRSLVCGFMGCRGELASVASRIRGL